MNSADLIVVTITGIGLVNCLIFCVSYALASRGEWARDEFGRFMMIFMAILGSLFALIVSARIWGEWPGRRAVSVALYVAYVLVSLWPPRLLWVAQKRARERERTKK